MKNFSISFIKIVKYYPRFNFADLLKQTDSNDEKVYFTKEDEKIMSKLMKKIQESNENQMNKDEKEVKMPKEELQKIFSNYRVTYNEALLKEILIWRKKN
ncbi:unnamed protein product [Paramecium primaurelia]|uniref:Uncharacterized protein n=1 Tax=Paramecium primaurelia TaxID=5886 RepID=A0A8S1KE85_PARPR|nr:unnamed protein product [Paramecium primaurelia]